MTAHAPELKKLLTASVSFTPRNSFIAGGALTSVFTGQPINDVDIYFKTKEAFIDAVRSAYEGGLWCIAASDRAVTFAQGDDIVQLMLFDFFEDANEIFDAFDFTVCMAAYDVDAESFVFHRDFFKHNAQRHLSFHSGTRYPFGSLLRTIKYRERGYKLGRGDLLRIALCCHGVKLESWDDLAAAVGGQYGERVQLETDKPFSVAAAIDLLSSSEFTVPATPEDMPGSADELLVKVGALPSHALAP